MMFKHGFVHCDPHAANLLVRPVPSEKKSILGEDVLSVKIFHMIHIFNNFQNGLMPYWIHADRYSASKCFVLAHALLVCFHFPSHMQARENHS